jgi:hypothetical protein
MPDYHTVYDVTAANTYSAWRLALAFLICAIALLWWRRSLRMHGAVRHWVIRTIILIGAAGAVIVATYEPSWRAQVREAIEHGTYQTIEGVISDYTPGDKARKIPEHFTVQTKDASHFTYILRPNNPGFHETQATHSPLRAGQCVRLTVVAGAIGRVEIADHC